jgi:hypothetical protein
VAGALQITCARSCPKFDSAGDKLDCPRSVGSTVDIPLAGRDRWLYDRDDTGTSRCSADHAAVSFHALLTDYIPPIRPLTVTWSYMVTRQPAMRYDFFVVLNGYPRAKVLSGDDQRAASLRMHFDGLKSWTVRS